MTSFDLKRIFAEELAHVTECHGPSAPPPRRSKFDDVLPGFGIRIYVSGRKVYVLQKRIAGKQRLVTIGSAAMLSEHMAKDVARRVILRIELGANPADDKQRGKGTPTYSKFLETYWQIVSPTWKPSTREIHDIYRRKHLNHAFKRKFLDEIGHADAVRWHAEVTRSAGPGAANRAMEILKAMFNKAEQWGVLPEYSNPFNGVKRNRGRKFERFLSEDEMSRLGRELANEREEQPLQVAVIKLLALTGCRRGEILHLKWSEVKGRKLKLEDSKTGSRIVWLGEEARSVLDAVPRVSNEDRVFPFEANPESKIDMCWRHIRQRARLANVRLHDLRHNYASSAARSSETLPMIGDLLGHKSVGTTKRYTHFDDAELGRNASVIGAAIAAVIE